MNCSHLVFGPHPAASPWTCLSRSHISSAVTSVRVRRHTSILASANGYRWKLPSPWPYSTAASSFVGYELMPWEKSLTKGLIIFLPGSVRTLLLQVIFNGVSILTLLIDAHMRISAIRFYLLSLVISGTYHFVCAKYECCQDYRYTYLLNQSFIYWN